MTRQDAHAIVDKVITEAEEKNLYGSVGFTFHFFNGEMRQITDEQDDNKLGTTWKRTHRGGKDG